MRKRLFNSALLSLVVLALAGCYQRTVSTRGIGSYGTAVQESYRSNTALDRWYDETFTSQKKTTRSTWIEK